MFVSVNIIQYTTVDLIHNYIDHMYLSHDDVLKVHGMIGLIKENSEEVVKPIKEGFSTQEMHKLER